MSYNDHGNDLEMLSLIEEIQNEVERLNIAMDKADLHEDLKHMIAALADKIDGLASLSRR